MKKGEESWRGGPMGEEEIRRERKTARRKGERQTEEISERRIHEVNLEVRKGEMGSWTGGKKGRGRIKE